MAFSILAVYVSLRKNKNLANENVKKRIGSLYLGLRTDNKEAIDYTSLFLRQRLLIIFTFLYGYKLPF